MAFYTCGTSSISDYFRNLDSCILRSYPVIKWFWVKKPDAAICSDSDLLSSPMAAAMATEENPLDELFSYLPYSTTNEIYLNITVETARRKVDWRALAGAMGFNEKQVTLIQQDTRRTPKGKLLIDVWEELGNASLRKLIYALKIANMGECLNILKEDVYLEG